MPPKPKYTKEEIVQTAYDIARKAGIDAVAARTIGRELGTTATPIFTFFSSMEELKEEVFRKAKEECVSYLYESVSYFPAFKEFGMRWIRYAVREPYMFKLLFASNGRFADITDNPMQEFAGVSEPILKGIQTVFGLKREDAADLFNQMILHANGIALFLLNHPGYLDDAVISKLLSRACIGVVLTMKIRDGELDTELARKMVMAEDRLPVKAVPASDNTDLN